MPTTAYKPAGRTEIAKLRKSLDELFERAFAEDAASEVAGDLTRLLCIRVSGFLEQSMLTLGRSACDRMSGGVVKDFALSGLERAPNPVGEPEDAVDQHGTGRTGPVAGTGGGSGDDDPRVVVRRDGEGTQSHSRDDTR